MIMKPIGDFENIRRSLPPQVQTQIDNLARVVYRMAEYMCELEPEHQSILIDLGADCNLAFVMSKHRQVTIHVMLEQPGNSITQQIKSPNTAQASSE